MTINLKEQAAKGSTVHFRCGGKAEITKVGVSCYHLTRISIDYCHLLFRYHHSGSYTTYEDHPFDIIRIDPPAFDWSTAKAGMAFVKHGFQNYGIFIGFNPEGLVVLENRRGNSDGCKLLKYQSFHCEELTRAPEHDIEVKS